MIGNIKETFPPKTGMWKRQVLQDPGYVRGVEGPCCMLSCKVVRVWYQLPHVKGVKRSGDKQNRLDLRPLCLMSKVLKARARYWMYDTSGGNIQYWRC